MLAEAELLEDRVRAAVGDERDRAAVGRPRRLQVGVLVAGQAAHLLRVEVVEEEVADAGGLAGDGDGVAVRRPGHVGDRLEARHA